MSIERSATATTGIQSQLFRAGLSALAHSGIARALSRWTGGRGAVLMLHRVRPEPKVAFAPNARLSISPDYLDRLLASLRAEKLDVIGLDEALVRLAGPVPTRRFVSFTLDDGYRDNLEHALPVFARHGAPFTVYATTSYADRSFAPWWYGLQYVLEQAREVCWTQAGVSRVFVTGDAHAKQRAFAVLSRGFMELPVAQVRVQLQDLLAQQGLSMRQLAERDMCDWSDLRQLAHAGAEIGCHAVSHPCLRRESTADVRSELALARAQLEGALARPVRHLAYPYGKREHVGAREVAIARELGFASAVTTRQGALFGAHASQLHALPRVEVTPSFAASPRYLQTILMGLPLWARNRGRLVMTL